MFRIRYYFTPLQRAAHDLVTDVTITLKDELEDALGRMLRFRGPRELRPNGMDWYSNHNVKWVSMIERESSSLQDYYPDWVEISVLGQVSKQLLLNKAPSGYVILQDDNEGPDKAWADHVGWADSFKQTWGDLAMVHSGPQGNQTTIFRDGQEENSNLDFPSVPDLVSSTGFFQNFNKGSQPHLSWKEMEQEIERLQAILDVFWSKETDIQHMRDAIEAQLGPEYLEGLPEAN